MSRLVPGLWRTPLARRFFALFVVCALLPLAIVATMSLTQVRSLLLQQGDQRLAATAKSFGMTVFERLQFAVDLANTAASAPGSALPDDSLPARAFAWLALVGPNGSITALHAQPGDVALPPEASARFARGAPAVLVSASTSRIRLAAPVSPGSFAVGELNPSYLWVPDDELPSGVSFCVTEDVTRRALYCTGSLHPSQESFAGSPSGRTHVWERDGERYRTRVWGQFMRAAFGTNDWIVVATQAERAPLKQLEEFRGLYLSAVAIAFLLVFLFTIRETRDIVGAVTLLGDRARGIARNEFDKPLGLARDDEFGELGRALEQMSMRLGRQFATLTALSEIDRLILNTQDTTHVVQQVVKRLREVAPAELITVTLFDHRELDTARTFVLQGDPGEAAEDRVERHSIDPGDRGALEAEAAGRWTTPGKDRAGFLSFAWAAGMRHAYVQPILWRGSACGAIVLAYREMPQAIAGEVERTRELADRVAVAVSSAWRDERLYAQAHYDPLTAAPNRLLFADRLTTEIARSQRAGLRFALLFIDLDHFKHVNDSYGHSAGDAVLREAVSRIAGSIRKSDTLARLGGDEFTVLATQLGTSQEAWLIAETIVMALSREFVLDAQRVFLSASVGIAIFPGDGENAEALLKNADTAMYRAKANGRSQVVFFEERMNAEAVMRMTLDRDLRAALERGELVVHYQPKLDLASGAIRSAEALIRWNHPARGWISPARFIPLAEESGFIEPLGDWILQQACADMRRWLDAGLELEHVSVNVSPRQFRKRAIVDSVQRCSTHAGVATSKLQLEITEGLLMNRGDDVEEMLQAIARGGHKIALDDFGTGFSSMAYLKRFPVHTIKIDKVFIEGLDASRDAEAIVTAIIAMSHALGKRVVAEGVETREQLECLRRLGCDTIQGFLVAAALPAAEFAALLQARAAQPEAV